MGYHDIKSDIMKFMISYLTFTYFEAVIQFNMIIIEYGINSMRANFIHSMYT